MVTFVEDQSSLVLGVPVRSKGDATDALHLAYKFNEEMRLKCAEGHEISPMKTLRTDRGGEFTSSVVGMAKESPFNRACSELGITQQFTSAEASNMNGLAEGHNRIVNDAWRCQLIDAGAPIEEWDLSAQAAIYAINRRPKRLLRKRDRAEYLAEMVECLQANKPPPPAPKDGWTTRYTLYTGLEANQQSLLPYGVPGYISTGKKGRKSDLERAEPVRRLGTPSNTPGHLVQAEDGTRKSTAYFVPDLHDQHRQPNQRRGEACTSGSEPEESRPIRDEQPIIDSKLETTSARARSLRSARSTPHPVRRRR